MSEVESSPTRRRAAAAAVLVGAGVAGGGGLLATIVAMALARRGLLAGPWLFAGSALGESLVVIVAATAVAAVVGAVAVRRRAVPVER